MSFSRKLERKLRRASPEEVRALQQAMADSPDDIVYRKLGRRRMDDSILRQFHAEAGPGFAPMRVDLGVVYTPDEGLVRRTYYIRGASDKSVFLAAYLFGEWEAKGGERVVDMSTYPHVEGSAHGEVIREQEFQAALAEAQNYEQFWFDGDRRNPVAFTFKGKKVSGRSISVLPAGGG